MDKVYLVVNGYNEDYSVKAVFTNSNLLEEQKKQILSGKNI